ncbi:MAG TPA: peroxiredoxin [Pyrinomonadaceae bacterium]|jgi:peroxiredoxin
MTTNLYELPSDLPVPVDDGAANHLLGMPVPPIELISTANRTINLAEVSRQQRTVVYCYPMTGAPGKQLPAGWDEIPGARGCTPQTCSFRDHFAELRALDALVFGLSTQTTEYQREMAQRLGLPFEVLSDADLAFTRALGLPTFEVESKTLLKRLTLILSQAEIVKVFYPVFPPDKNVEEVIAWLSVGRRDES